MRRIVDLTMPIHEGMQTFPAHWHPFVEVSQMGRHGIENRETRKLVLGTHTGTHMDAPLHFIPGGATVDEIPLEQIVGPATLVDLSHAKPFHGVSQAELSKAIGNRPVERTVIRFDWNRMLGTMAYYTDQPFLMEEAAQWLIEKGCRLIALDAAMPDDPKNGRGCDKDSPNHKILLGKGAVIVEYLVNLKEIDAPTFELVVAPIKVRGGDGAPARVFGIVEGK